MSHQKFHPTTFRCFLLSSFLMLFCILPSAKAVIRDGGIDPENLGKGGWLYVMQTATNKLNGSVNSVTNANSLFAYLKSQGLRFVIVKAGTTNMLWKWSGGVTAITSTNNAAFTRGLVDLAHANGLLIFASNRSGGDQSTVTINSTLIAGEAAIADYAFNQGADGFIWDAESQWESTSNTGIGTTANAQTLAWQLGSTVRSNWPTKFLAHNPFDTRGLHSAFPYKEFGYWSDAVMPQVYHHTQSQDNPSAAIAWTDYHFQVFHSSLTNTSSVINGETIYWTNAIKPIAMMRDIYVDTDDADTEEFIDYLAADPNSLNSTKYTGGSFYRADYPHTTGQWSYIKAGTLGQFSDTVANIVLDDAAATATGTWTKVRTINPSNASITFSDDAGSQTNAFGTNYWRKAQGTGAAYMEYTPNVLVPGDYKIYQWHPTRSDASAGVPFVISYYGGSTTNLANQQTNGGYWSYVGRYPFNTGTSGTIRVMDNFAEAGAVALVDGLKMVFVKPVSIPAAPSSLTASATTSTQINLTWSDNSTNESSFVVRKSTTSGGPYSDVANVAPNSTSYSVTGLTPDTTYYFVVCATNYLGASANSAQASAKTFAVGGTTPGISQQPQTQSVVITSNAVFSVTATGTAPLSYQWRFNTTNIAGATLSSYTRTNVQTSDAGSYSVIITNAYGTITSSNAVLTVTILPPSITAQPQNATNNAGTIANFSVTATGTAPLAYQWKKNGSALGNGGNIAGATSANLTLTSVTSADAADYSVTITNSAGTVTSSNATLVVNSIPTITSNPVSQTNNAGSTVVFSVTASGSLPLSYQWKKTGTNLVNGGNISGATSASLTISSISQADAANYTVQVTNNFGSASSSAAALIVIDPATITSQPVSRTNNAGTLATFTVVASGTSPTYKWLKNGVALSNGGTVSGATSATLNLASVSSSDAANYSVIVSNSAANVTSDTVTLTVLTAPTISGQPQNQTVSDGANVTFSVTASGTAPLSYRWRFNGVTISGATDSAYTKNNVQTNDAGNYSVVITNLAGSVTSSNATLTVNVGLTQVISVSNLWSITAGSRSYVTVGNTERGIAINTVSNHVLIVSRATNSGAIVAVSASTGSDLGLTLNAPAGTVTGGTFVLNKIGVTADGVVYAANLATTNTQNFRIYRWTSYSATPVVAYSGLPDGGATPRWGDSFAITGTGTGTQIIIGGSVVTGGPATTNVVVFTTTNGTNFTPTVIMPSPAQPSGGLSRGLCFGSSGTFFVKNRAVTSATNFAYNLGTGTATQNSTIGSLDSNMLAIGYDSTHQLFSGLIDDNTTSNSGHVLKVYDISNIAIPSLLGSFYFPTFGAGTNSANSNFAGHVDTDGNKIVSLDTQNGIIAVAVNVQTSPEITAQPIDQSAAQGQSATFTVTASGSAPLSYQWKKNGTNLTDGIGVSGATAANLTISSISVADEADYTVTVSNPIGSVDSTPAALTVIVPPSIVADPTPQTVNSGDSANFTVTASGTETLYYQWKKGTTPLTNGVNVFGATSANLVLANVAQANAGDYSVTVTNAAGQISSQSAHLTVIDPPTITTNPTAQTVVAGTTATFSGAASGSNLGYQWKKNGVALSNGGNISGALTATLSLTGVSQTDVADYSLFVTNSAGNATSTSAHLTVVDAPVITGQPASRTNNVNTAATFTVFANGQSISYQWKKNGVPLSNGGSVSGATSTTLTLASVTLSDVADYTVTVTNIAGTQTSSAAHLEVIVPPTITSQPVSVTNNPGTNATFAVTVSSSATVTYQWKKDGNPLSDGGNIGGANTAILTVSSVTQTDSGDYSVTASNSAGSTNSTSAHLTVTTAPEISLQPANSIKGAGSNAVFTVTATGSGPLSYQWRKNGTNLVNGGRISGATSTNLTIASAMLGDSGNYSVVVTNTAGSAVSDDGTLLVIDRPIIVSSPISQTNASGTAVYLYASATGDNLAYRWQRNGVDLTDENVDVGRFSGMASSTLAILDSTPSDSGTYRVVVSNPAGSATTAAANLTVLDIPVILTQPSSRTNGANTIATFTVTASGSSLVYQWRKDGNPLVNGGQVSGANTATLSIKSLTSLNNGDYSVLVSNVLGSDLSSPAHLTVLALPAITTQPVSRTNVAGSSATFSVVASGVNLSYQWKKAGIPIADNYYISGANTPTLSFNGVLAGDTASYSVFVSNPVGNVSSKAVNLKVVVPPTITAQPLSRTNVSGTTASFTVLCSGTTPLTYQWYKNGVPLVNGVGVSGATAATLSLPATTQSSAADYSVTVSNYAGTATSSSATLTIVDAISIVSQPTDATNYAGNTATFSIAVTGSNPGYQWRKGTTLLVNGGDISGATSDTLQIQNLKLTDAGLFSVVVSNFAGKQISSSATLTVLSAPIITNQPIDQLVVYGSNAVFSVKTTGTAPILYQWKRDGTNLVDSGHISGATSSTLTVIGAVNSDEGNYSVLVSNSVNEVASHSAALTIVPFITILKPMANATVTSGLTNVTGTASDHGSVTQVLYSWNGGTFVAATGTTNWATPLLNFTAGTNTIIVKSINSVGRESKPLTRNFFYPVVGSLTLITNGIGTMTPNLAAQTLYVGRNYSISAMPGIGQLFSNWTGTYTTNNKILTFRMLTNVTLQANFVTNLFIPRAGTYTGLFFETNNVTHESSGLFKLVVSTAGSYSGNFYLSGSSRSMSGQFDLSGKSTFIYKGVPALTFALDLATSNGISDRVYGTVSNASWTAKLDGDRVVYSAANLAPRTGKYLMALAGTSDGAFSPGGDGYATVTISTNGVATIAGTLSDGTGISQSTYISKDGQLPFYVSLYTMKGSILGWLTVTNRVTSSIEGDVSWIKKGGTTTIAYYANGFTNDLTAMGSDLPILNAGVRGLDLTNGLAIFDGADLTRAVTNTFTLNNNNVITIDPGQNDNVVLTIATNTGIISGSFFDRTSGTKVPVKGVLLQKQNTARGYFLSTPDHVSGSFLIQSND